MIPCEVWSVTDTELGERFVKIDDPSRNERVAALRALKAGRGRYQLWDKTGRMAAEIVVYATSDHIETKLRMLNAIEAGPGRHLIADDDGVLVAIIAVPVLQPKRQPA